MMQQIRVLEVDVEDGDTSRHRILRDDFQE